MEKHSVSKATLGRLPLYPELLKNLTPERFPYISATTIARKLSLGDVQVRKDLASVCSNVIFLVTTPSSPVSETMRLVAEILPKVAVPA